MTVTDILGLTSIVVFYLFMAHPGSPAERTKGRKTVVVVIFAVVRETSDLK